MPRHVADIHGVLSLIRATHEGAKSSSKNELTALLDRAASQNPLISPRRGSPALSLSLSLSRARARSLAVRFFSAPRKRARRGTRYIGRRPALNRKERGFSEGGGKREDPLRPLPPAFGPFRRVIS